MSVIDDLLEEKKKREAAQAANANPFLEGYKADDKKVWSDWRGNVNISNLTTGDVERYHDNGWDWGYKAQSGVAKEDFGTDLMEQIQGSLTRQGASYKNAIGTAALGLAGLANQDNNYKPEVGSWLWRVTEGAKADKARANELIEDAKYGKGALHGFVMDVAGGAVDLAGDTVLNAIAPGSGLAAMGVRSFGEASGEARDQGKSILTQVLKGAKSAAIEIATEGLWEYGGVKGVEGTGLLQSALDKSYARIVERGGNALLNKMAFAFGTEAVEEMLSDVLNPAVDKVVRRIVKGDYDVDELASLPEILYDGLIGGALGLLGGFGEGIQTQSQINAANAEGKNGAAIVGKQLYDEASGKQAAGIVDKALAFAKIKTEMQDHVDKALQRAGIETEAESTEAPTTPVEAQMPSAPTEIAPTIQNEVKQEAGEFNSKPEVKAAPTPDNIAEAAPQMAPVESPVEGDNLPFTIGKETPDDDRFGATESREALEEVSRWGKDKPIEDTTDAEKEGKEFSPEETTDVFHGEADEERLRSLAEQEKEQDRRQAEYFEKKDAGSAKKASKAGADLLVNQAESSKPTKAETEPVKSGADLLAEQAKADKQKTSSKKTETATADEPDAPNVTREERIDAAKRRELEKLGKDYTDIRDRLAKRKKAKSGDNISKYDNVDVSDKNVPAKERLQSIKDLEKAKLMDEVDDYVGWWMNHREIVDGENMSDIERMRLLPKKIERFLERYDADHNYEWEIANNDNDVIRVYSDKVNKDVKSEEFNLRYSDEQLAENAKNTRLKHALSYDLSTEEIAKLIKPKIKPKLLTQHFNIGADGINSYPYSINLSWPQRTNKDGKRVPVLSAAGGQYTVEIYNNDAKTDTAVRLFRFKAKNEAAASKIAANIIRDFELGGLPAKEAVIKQTRKQIADEFTKQLDERTGDNPLVKQAAPKYPGTYTVGPFTVDIGIATKKDKGMTFFDGYKIKVLLDGHILDEVKTDGQQLDINPVQYAASLVHNYNFERGPYYDFSWFKHRANSPFEKAWTVTAKNGKSIVTAPNGSVTETDVGRAAIDDINKAQGKPTIEKEEKGVFKSNFEPKIVEVDGKLYEVVQDWMSKNAIQHVICEVDANGNRIDNKEATVNVKNALMVEDAVRYALDKKLFRDNTSDKSMKSAEDYAIKVGKRERKANQNGSVEEGNRNGDASERRNDNGVSQSGGDNDTASGNPEAVNGGDEKAKRQAARRALRGGEQVSLDELFLQDGYSSDKSLTFIGEKEHTREMKALSKAVKAITGKDVQFVRGRWGKDFDPDSESRAVAWTSADGEIVFNLDYYEYARSKGSKNSISNILYHESFHSLVAQNPAIMVFAKKTMNKLYGDKAYQSAAQNYAYNLMAKEDADAFFDKHDSYPSWVYEEMAGDVFGNAERYSVKLENKATVFRDEIQKALGALAGNPAKAAKLNEIVRSQEGFTREQPKPFSETEGAGIEAAEEPPSEEKAKSTFGKDYEKVQKSADDFDSIKTRFDEEAFQKSDKGQDRKTRNKLKKLREAFRKAATTGDVESLFSLYSSLKEDSNLSNFFNEEIQEDIDNWRKLSDPNLDSYNEGAAPHAAARTLQRMAHKFKLANEYQQTLSKMNETLRGSKNGVLRKIGKSEKLTSAVARALVRWQVNPDTVFKMIDAFDKGNAGEGYKLAKELQEAHREKYRVLREARAKFDKASELKGYQDFAFGKQTVKDYSGREWDMRSALSVIKAIDTIRSTSGKKLGGTDGFGVMDSKGNVEFINMKDVDAIKLYDSLKSGLSDVAAKYGELATEAFNDVKEPLRAKYKQNNGIDIGMVGDEDTRLGDKKGVEKAVYSPLSYVDKNGNVYQFDIAKQETYNNIPRFLRERSDAGGTYILIKPYTEVTGKYFEQVSNYLAYSTFNEKMRGLGKGSSYESGLGNTLADVFGKDMGNWYRSYVEDLATYQNEDDVEGVNSLLRQGRQQLQQGALLFSVSVPMKQISSYWAASGILHPDSLIKNYRIKLLKPKNSSDAATMLASRAMGNLEQSAAEAAKDAKKWLGKLKYSSKFIELAANAINQMDYNTVSNLLSATEYDVLKYQFGGDKSVIGTDEYKAAVEEKFQDVVDRSQPNFDKQMRAEYGRTDNEVIRMLSMFRTQQTQNLNLLATAIGEYQAAKGTANQAAATETLKQTIAGQAASAFSLSMLTILADMLLHRQKKYEDDEQEIDASKVLTRLGINAIEASSGTLWFGDTIAKWAIDQISGGKTKEFYGVNMGVISTVSDILENFETAIKSPTRSNIKKCAGNIATIMGVPLNNAYSMLNSAIMYAKDLTGNNEGDYDDILKYLDAQTKAAKKEEEKAAKAAAKAEAKSGADLLAEAAKQNSSQSELNSAQAKNEPKVSGWKTKQYDALVGAGMSSERSIEVLTEMDTDHNDSVKQSEMIAYWKAHPEDEQYVEAMWNSYGYKTSWEKAKKKAG